MSKVDQFRREAELCERMARTLSRAEGRTEYHRMADQWRQLADRLASLEEKPGASPHHRHRSGRH